MQPNPGAVQRKLPASRQSLQSRGENRRRQSKLELPTQQISSYSGQIRIFRMKRCEPVDDAALKLQPSLR